MNIYSIYYIIVLSIIIIYSILSLIHVGFYFNAPYNIKTFRYIRIVSIFMIILYCIYIFMTLPVFIYTILIPVLNIMLIPFLFIYAITFIPLIIAIILSNSKLTRNADNRNLIIIMNYFFLFMIILIHLPFIFNLSMISKINNEITKRTLPPTKQALPSKRPSKSKKKKSKFRSSGS